MKLFEQLFHKKENQSPPPLPSWEEVVEGLYDKNLDSFPHDVIEVLYSRDRSERYVILKSKAGFYTYLFQRISTWDKDEWVNLSSHENIAPGWWEEPLLRDNQKSFLGSLEELKAELYAEVDYQQHFVAPPVPGQHYCPYMHKHMDEGLCYDMQMAAHGYLTANALPEVEIEHNSLLAYCEKCKFCL